MTQAACICTYQDNQIVINPQCPVHGAQAELFGESHDEADSLYEEEMSKRGSGVPEPKHFPTSGGGADSEDDSSEPEGQKKRRDSSIFVLILLLLFLCPCLFALFGPATAIRGAFGFLAGNESYPDGCSEGVVGDPTNVGDPTGTEPTDADSQGYFQMMVGDGVLLIDQFRRAIGGEGLVQLCGQTSQPGGTDGEEGGGGAGYCGAICTSDADCAANYVCLPVGQCWVQACDSPISSCGDGACTTDESAATCPADCGSCGNGVCDPEESSTSCPADCGQCGNGVCDPGEHVYNCSRDCGEPPAPQEPTNPPVCTCVCDRVNPRDGKCEAGHDSCTGAACLP